MQSRQSLQLRQQQQLVLTPQLQQSIRFLQLGAQDLELEVAQALADNPLLEREGEYDTDPSAAEDAVLPEGDAEDIDGAGYRDHVDPYRGHENSDDAQRFGRERSRDDDYFQPEAGTTESLRDHLLQQLRVTRATRRDQALVTLLIEELNENGLLQTPIDDILMYLNEAFTEAQAPQNKNTGSGDHSMQQVSREEIMAALRLLQSFDPSGVGAQSIAECLQIQLRQTQAGHELPVFTCAMTLVGQYLDVLAAGNFIRLRALLGASPAVLQQAHHWVLTLNPKPGRAWAQSVADYVRPEIVLRRSKEGQWQAHLNPAVVPRLRVNPDYEQWLQLNKAKQGVKAVRGSPVAEGVSALQVQLQQAHGLIKSMAQRFETVLRVAQFIVVHQQVFFEKGPQAMQPLVLREIADALGLHESTVSRATRHKYAQTPWGTFELKYFLGASLGGGALVPATSATAVRAMVRRLISEEPAGKPLSDNKIALQLAAMGVEVARRTVAKYRETEGLDVASIRKAKARLKH